MHRNFKKLLSILLVTVMVFGSAPLAGFVGIELPELNPFVFKAEAATHSGKCGSTAWWEYDSITRVLTVTGTGEISSYSWDNDKQSYNRPWEQYVSNIKQIVIDEGITTIGMEAFANHRNVQTIQLPDSLEELFFRAFYDCSSLKNIIIPNNVISIGASSFGNCSSLSSVILPNSLTSLYGGAFHNCTSLESVTLSNSLTTLESNTFGGCSKLESVVIPNSVTTLKENVFSFCINLKEITLSNNISQISDGAFDNCLNLSDIYYDGTYSDFSKISIGVNNKQLAYVTIYCSDSVSIGIFGSCGDEIYWSFHGESGVFSVSGNGYMNAYYPYTERPWDSYRNDVKHIIINEGITDIGWHAFCYFYNLETIVIPISVKQIDEKALYYLNSLTDIYYCGTETQWNEIIIDENNDTFENVRIHYSTPTGKCGDNLNWIFDEVSKTLTVLGVGAMYDYSSNNRPWETCKNEIKTIVLNEGVTRIGNYSFSACTNLSSVSMPNSMLSIGNSAFYYCTEVTTVIIPINVTQIGSRSFKDCLSLIDLTIGESVETIGFEAFSNCSSLNNITIPNSVVTIGSKAFYCCRNLTQITIPKSVNEIGDSVFSNCNNLIGILVDKENQYFTNDEYGVLFNKDKSLIIKYPEGRINKNYIIPNGVSSVQHGAFSNNSYLTNITIPNSVTSIGNNILYDSSCIETIYYNGTEEQWNQITISSYNDDLFNTTIHYMICTHKYEATVTQSSCSKVGYTTYTCLLCSDTYVDDEVPVLGHDIIIDEAVVPTCTETGLTEGQHCSRCDDVTIEQEIVPALNHKDTLVQVDAKSPTCTETGLTEGQHCSRCDDVTVEQEIVPALNHKDTLVQVEAKAPTCTEIGWDAYEYCTACTYTTYEEKAALKHDIVIDNAVEPTCTKTGLTEGQHCSRCDDVTVEQEIVPALNHKDTLIKVEAKSPTCTEIGWDAYEYCTACEYTTYVEKEALDHNIIIDEAIAATCTETGLTEGQHCSRCASATVEQETIPMKDHNHIVKYDSTKHWKECVCGSKIEMQNHTFDGNSLCECGYKRVVNATIVIKNNSGSRTINYGETLKLTAVTNNKPYDAKIYWYVDGVLMGEGEIFNVSFESGAKIVTVKLVDSNGYVLQNADGNEISDNETVTVKSGFFQKLISFFKNLFGIGRTVVQSIRF